MLVTRQLDIDARILVLLTVLCTGVQIMTLNGKSLLTIVSLFLTSMALGRDDLTVRWGHQLETPTDDVARAAVVDSNDDIYFTVGRKTKDASGATTSEDLFLLKYNQQGDQLWSKQFDPGLEDATGLAADDQGNIYVFGFVSSTPERETKGKNDVVIAKSARDGLNNRCKECSYRSAKKSCKT